MISFATINYFSLDGLPYILLALLSIWLCQPLATLVHEGGHALFAYILSRGKVIIHIGEARKNRFSLRFKIGKRLFCSLSIRNPRSGVTVFKQTHVLAQCLILIGGPLISFTLCFHAGFLLFSQNIPPSLEAALAGWFCVNLLGLMRALLPAMLQPSKSFPHGVPSDGLQLLRLMSGGKSET